MDSTEPNQISVIPSHLSVLEKYVGKVFYHEYNEIEIILLLGGIAGDAFFLCRMVWSDYVYCSDPLEVLPLFDDYLQPYDDFNVEDIQ